MPDTLSIRKAITSDIEAMKVFIFEHGPNPWNHSPPREVSAHIEAIATGAVQGVIAEKDTMLAGFVTFQPSTRMARYRSLDKKDQPHGFVAEAVVHRDFAKQGLGTLLLQEAVKTLAAQGLNDIYIDRHEENAGSAGMMRRAGFVEIDTYDDPERRLSGSRRSTVCYIRSPS